MSEITVSPWRVEKRNNIYASRPFFLVRERTECGIALPETHRTKAKRWDDCTRAVYFKTEAAAQARAEELNAGSLNLSDTTP